MRTLTSARTPALVLDRDKAARNMARMRDRLAIAAPGLRLRPHLKTAKSIPVAEMLFAGGRGPITVSTLREAEVFGEAGFTDVLYAVGLDPSKIGRVAALRRRGIDLKVITDNPEVAGAISAAAAGSPIPTLIEIDVDGHRAGLPWANGAAMAAVAAALGSNLAGVMTHAGGSYALSEPDRLARASLDEARRAVHAADLLRQAGFSVKIVSIGSTPTGLSASDLTGVSEFRAGVFMFGDLVMHGIGVCPLDHIALSVLASVTGFYPERGRAIIDAGWMALSRDRGTAEQAVDQGYGLVCDLDGRPLDDVVVIAANQEHGTIAPRPGSGAALPPLRVGDRVRVLPNHACATAAQHGSYEVIEGGSAEIVARWERFHGW